MKRLVFDTHRLLDILERGHVLCNFDGHVDTSRQTQLVVFCVAGDGSPLKFECEISFNLFVISKLSDFG